ncbi:MAG TPA: polymer-forming cytoskeletal protein, partial [Rhodobacteraceae bacterium]|nr:polymer-forming cytoskeletal protein [Paracoccaceae bacterium]
MFTKKPDAGPTPLNATVPPPTPPKPPLPPSAAAAGTSRPAMAGGARAGEKLAPSVIGADLAITGNLKSNGEIQIEGSIQGDLHGTHVVIGERAKITGGIVADDV